MTQKIRRLEEVNRPFTKEEKKWIIKNLIGTILCLAITIPFYSYYIGTIIEKLFF